ncbi:protein-serine/threonine phosphatase [Ranunculus cassubicifolius]
MAKTNPPPISIKQAVHKLQLSLLEGIRHESQLTAASSLISRNDYQDVVTERTIANLCGYPLCNNPLPSDRPRKGRYRISLKEHKVYDLHETYLYCCTSCVVNSRVYAESLQPERPLVSNSGKINEILKLFGDLGSKDLGKNGDLGFGDLKIEEKLDVKMGQMSLDDWIGPSNAIEGYVPVIDRSFKKPSSSKKPGIVFKPKSPKAKTDKGKPLNHVDFTSTIIMGDQSGFPECSSDPNLKEYIAKLEGLEADQFINVQVPSIPVDSGSELSSSKKPSSLKKRGNVSKPKSPKAKEDKGKSVKPVDFTSTIIMGNQSSFPECSSDPKLKKYITKLEELEAGQSINLQVPSIPLDSGSELSSLVGEPQFGIPVMPYDAAEGVSNRDAKELKKEVFSEKVAEQNEASLKSSLKSSGVRKLDRSVTWADQKSSGTSKLIEVREMSEIPGNADLTDEEDDDGSMFLRSAQACARALNQASEAVVSGEADVADAVSEAGIIILPQSHNDDDEEEDDEDNDDEDSQTEGTMDDDTLEEDLVPLKWPKKPGVFNSEVFNAEDSWYEPPPEGFSVNLSSFATMYMALFGWITSSSLAYIYGQEDQSHEDFVFANGREYPGKIVLSDGRSSEIKVTLAGCLSRALPKVAADLRLKTPTFVIEKELGQLLNTMSFLDSIPAFKLKQWHVIVLLFVDALSVCRIPGIAPHMTGGRILLQMVLEGGQVSGEEYEIMKDLLIPLGRVPQFSAQSGA